MKLLEVDQIRRWDELSIEKEGIQSIELMERAAKACVEHLMHAISPEKKVWILCGTGNNGGDGLAIARLLYDQGYRNIHVACDINKEGSPDRENNLNRIKENASIRLYDLDPSRWNKADIIIDCLFGTGINRPLEGEWLELIEAVNALKAEVISVDIPSGMPAGHISAEHYPCVDAEFTLTFQIPKLSFFRDDYAVNTGEVVVLDIGLDPEIQDTFDSPYYYLDHTLCQSFFHPRQRIAHKGQHGNLLLVAGSEYMGGAGLITAKSALRSGVGLCTIALPERLSSAAYSYIPEAMQLPQNAEAIQEKHDQKAFSALGVGPGIGQSEKAQALLKACIACKIPHVFDADALNMISTLGVEVIPPGSIITPHPGEFDRLFGKHTRSADRLDSAITNSKKGAYTTVLKGHRSAVVGADGRVAMSLKGNSILAKGGSGDVLCGMVSSFLAQGYEAFEAACLSVYLHGLAADLAAEDWATESLLSGELCDYISEALILMQHAEENA